MDAVTDIATDAPAPALSSSIGSLLMISLAILVGFTMLQSFAIMAESAKAEMHLSDAALGAVQGMSAAIPIVLLSIPIGVWVDRRRRVLILTIMAACWTFGTLVTAVSPSTAILFVGRMLTGIGTTGGLTAVLSLASDYCRPEQRGRAMLIPNIAKTIGIAAGFTVAGLLLGAFSAHRLPSVTTWTPWRNAQLLLGIGSALLTLPLLLIREPARHEVEAGPSAPLGVLWAEVQARRKWIIPLFIGQTSVVMADSAGAIWISPVLQRNYHLQPADFAGWLGVLILIVGIIGTIIGGVIADVGQKSRIRGGLLLGALFASMLGVPGALFPIMPSVVTVGVGIGLLLLAGSVTAIIASVALTVWLPNELRWFCIGAFIAIAGLIGLGIAPLLVTVVSAWLGGEQHLAPALAGVGVVVGLLSVAAFAAAIRGAPVSNLEHAIR